MSRSSQEHQADLGLFVWKEGTNYEIRPPQKHLGQFSRTSFSICCLLFDFVLRGAEKICKALSADLEFARILSC